MQEFIINGDLTDPFRSFISKSRYARWIPEYNRRETWEETVNRYADYISPKVGLSPEDKQGLIDQILNHRVMPSMRALMTAGESLERSSVAGYNCSLICIDDLRAFDEALYILMCGTGLGFSAEKKHVRYLPAVPEQIVPVDKVIVVHDSKEGWAQAYRELIESLFRGELPKWDLRQLRPEGARLKTFGGRSSGPEPLNDLFEFTVVAIHAARGRKLKPIEVHDLMCKIGSVVVVGGVRRCFTGYTQITTPSGMVLGKDIAVGDMIVSGGRKARVSAKIDSGRQQTVIVKHKYGQSEVTPNHRIAVFDGVDSYTFKEAGSLEIGDRLVWDLHGYDGEIRALPRPTYSGHFNAKPFVIPEVVDSDVAWLIGLIHGDGHIHAKGIEISSNDGEWNTLERANSIFGDKFGVSGTVSNDSHGGHGIRLRINSTGLALWMAENVKTPNATMDIPDFISEAQRDIRAAYLAGVLDSDGRVRADGVIEQVTSIYPGFVSQIVSLLRGLGIPAKVYNSSAQMRRDSGVNAKDFQSVMISGQTGRQMYLDCVMAHSERELRGVFRGSPVDFTYPAEWNLLNKNRNTQRTTMLERGLLSNDFPFAPVAVEAVELGGIEQTWDIEIEDIHEFTADGLVTHNSALISLSSLSDDEIRDAKSGEWWNTHPHRALSNNSAVYNSKPTRSEFDREWDALVASGSGERGIFNLAGARKHVPARRNASKIMGTNPCSEILLRNMQFCNLSEIIVREDDSLDSLKEKVRWATKIGTWQSTLTNFSYLREQWKINAEEERLLGVSMTGQMSHPVLNGREGREEKNRWLRELKRVAISTNRKEARRLGINPAAAISTGKPSGTVSTLTNTPSGMHPWHDKYFIRTVRSDKNDPLARFMEDAGVPVEEDVMNPKAVVFSFPFKAPEGAITRNDVTAIDQLENWLDYKTNWTEHSPSITVSVKPEEWEEVGDWVFDHFDLITGVSFLPYSDHVYKQAPFQAVSEQEYYEAASKMPKSLDWEWLPVYESEDTTTGSQQLSCTAGVCDVVDLVADKSV